MRLRLSCFLLILCLFWSGLGAFEPAPGAARSTGPGQVAEAALDVPGPGGSSAEPLDGLPSPAPADPTAEVIALLPPMLLSMPVLASGRPPGVGSAVLPAPYLEGPQRPPRHSDFCA
jgi:hypothetical protein